MKKQITKPKSFLTRKVALGYTCGQIGWALLAGLIASQLTVVWTGFDSKTVPWKGFISVSTFAAIFAVTKLIDAFSAPLVGRISDRLDTKWGRRIPLMAIAILPFAILTVLAFMGLSDKKTTGTDIASIAFLVIVLSLFYMSLSIYMIPFTALISDLGRTSEERVMLSTYNAISFFIGTILAYTAPIIWSVFLKAGLSFRLSFVFAIAILAVAAVCLMLIPIKVIKEKSWVKVIKKEKKRLKSEQSLWRGFAEVFKDRQFRLIILADFFLWIGLIGFQTELNNFVVAVLGIGIKNTIYFAGVSGVVSLIIFPLVGKWMNKIGTRKFLVQLGFVCYLIVFIYGALMVLNRANIGGTAAWINGMIMVTIVGFPSAIMGVVKNVMISDVIATNNTVHGEDTAATYFAVRNFTSKIGMAIGLGISVSLLNLGKTEANPWGVRAIFLFCGATTVLGFISLSFYKEIKYRFNNNFFRFVNLNKKIANLKSKKNSSNEEITALQAKADNFYQKSKQKTDYDTTKIIGRLLKRIKSLEIKNNSRYDDRIKRYLKDVKTYNVVRVEFALKEINHLSKKAKK